MGRGKIMKTRIATRVLIWLLVELLAMPAVVIAQDNRQPAGTGANVSYSQEELDRLLAPIALYPDALLSQMLMASTYPLEVVEANRWLRDNPNLAGESLNEALKAQPWDASVKSLCQFPQILSTMSEHLEETSSLGNAFLSQQDQVMDTIQNLREKAQAEGNLYSTDQQKVIVEDSEIIIEPEKPDVLYVPTYDPCCVYGTWWYPNCSPLWFWYPGFSVSTSFIFGPPIYIGPWGFWSGFYWHRHRVFVDARKTPYFHKGRDTRRHGGREIWRHDYRHRRGFPYRNRAVRERSGGVNRPGAETRRDFRGFRPEVTQPLDSNIERREVLPRTREDRRPTMRRPEVRTRQERLPEILQQPTPAIRTPEVRTGQKRLPQLRQQRLPAAQPRRSGTLIERPRVGGDALQGTGRGPEVRQQSDRGWRSNSGRRIDRPSGSFPGGRGGGWGSGRGSGWGGGRGR